ncbi:hypothetical protein V5L02_004233, partial [Enterobacter hormaechei]
IILDKVNAAKDFFEIDEIKNSGLSKQKELFVIIKNIKNLSYDSLEKYVKNEAFPQFKVCENENLKTYYRKLFLAYDLLTNGDIEKLQ